MRAGVWRRVFCRIMASGSDPACCMIALVPISDWVRTQVCGNGKSYKGVTYVG